MTFTYKNNSGGEEDAVVPITTGFFWPDAWL
jgi:hypothetical protein